MKSAFITWIDDSFQASEELMFCLTMLRKKIPSDVDVYIQKSEMYYIPTVSDILSAINCNYYDFLFIAVKPDFIISAGSCSCMIHLLMQRNDMDCILPLSIHDRKDIPEFSLYYTLSGFEKLALVLNSKQSAFTEKKNCLSPLFLLRIRTLMMLPPEAPVNEIMSTIHPQKITSTYHALLHSFSSYYGADRTELLHLIPQGISSMLDIGCATGNFGRAVKNKVGCKVVGIDLNPYEAEIARQYLDTVITGDFLNVPMDEQFDCIACLDIIEHICSTAAFLEKARMLLKEKGYLLVSIPNIGHWSIVEDLMMGRWDYVPAGIQCISHLRFFTKKSVTSLLEDTGFDILIIEEQKGDMPDYFKNILDVLKQSPLDIDQESLSSYGYQLLARKKT
jgi:2-polyprenyl-3-methyl-5-hydroxy-6-metoxy-1,4-benzoquinol methylase